MKRPLAVFLALMMVLLSVVISAASAEEWVCSNCGNTNTTNFCTFCGAKHDVWICTNCGTVNSDAFCGNCGSAKPDIIQPESHTFDELEKTYGAAIPDNDLAEIPVRFALTMEGNSMDDAIHNGDLVEFEVRDVSTVRRFDIVATHYPDRGDTLFIKRVIGLPGDTVHLEDGYLYIREAGSEEEVRFEEKYINDQYRIGYLNNFGPYIVPEGMYFVLGDRRDNSNDSRSQGPFDAGMICGVAVSINGAPVPDPMNY